MVNGEFLDFERRGWEDLAGSYTGIDGVTADCAGALLDAAAVGPSSVVLDVASGPGYVAALASDRGCRVIGVDIAEAMVADASRRFPDIEFRQGSAEHLPFDDEAFDAVVAAFGMPHFADHSAFAASAFRVLRGGGRLAFSSWYPPERSPFLRVALRAVTEHAAVDVALPAGVDMFHWADQGACQGLLSEAGFGDASRRDVDLVWESTDGPAGMKRFLEQGSVRTGAIFKGQSERTKKAIADDLVDTLRPFERDGLWRVPIPAFVVSAAKPT